jgi:sirohydrochlorin ferrochelatase
MSSSAITALLLIAHGSRRAEANQDLEYVAQEILSRGAYPIVQPSYLEISEPSINAGGALCIAGGASRVILLPYFLSAGVHVEEDLREARDRLALRFPKVEFLLAAPLGRHPALIDILLQRVSESIGG